MLVSGQNGEDRSFEFKRAKTLEVGRAKRSKSEEPDLGEGIVVLSEKEEEVEEELQSSPPRCKSKKQRIVRDGHPEFLFSLDSCGNIDMV